MAVQECLYRLYERHLRSQCTHIPCHIAIIQDGNRRFAKMAGVQVSQGHRMGADVTERMLDWAHELSISHITLYSFSTENFRRDQGEVSDLFELFKEKFRSFITDERVHKYRIRIRMLGDRSLLPPDLLAVIREAEEASAHYDGFFLNIAIAYGGRNEIVHAAREILAGVEAGEIPPDAITPGLVEKHLYPGVTIPPVDLIIRTGNEFRTSNFLPWLASGHESAVYFCIPFWPQFRMIDLLRAIRVYSQRLDARQMTT